MTSTARIIKMFKLSNSIARQIPEFRLQIVRFKTTTSTSPWRLYKRSYEYKNRVVLNAKNHHRLKLGLLAGKSKPAQWTLPTPSPDPKVVKNERRLLTDQESQSPYQDYDKKDIEQISDMGQYFDPLFNPNINDLKYQINPEEEPFNAIYQDSKSDLSKEYTGVRNITTPELWQYVERLARIKVAPEPKKRKLGEPLVPLPSGYIPPPENPPDLPYFVARTRNHLLPVYYFLNKDPEMCFTMVKQVTGDLWKLEEDLRNHLESVQESNRRILTSVEETDERISFRGRHLHEVVAWLHEKGF